MDNECIHVPKIRLRFIMMDTSRFSRTLPSLHTRGALSSKAGQALAYCTSAFLLIALQGFQISLRIKVALKHCLNLLSHDLPLLNLSPRKTTCRFKILSSQSQHTPRYLAQVRASGAGYSRCESRVLSITARRNCIPNLF